MRIQSFSPHPPPQRPPPCTTRAHAPPPLRRCARRPPDFTSDAFRACYVWLPQGRRKAPGIGTQRPLASAGAHRLPLPGAAEALGRKRCAPLRSRAQPCCVRGASLSPLLLALRVGHRAPVLRSDMATLSVASPLTKAPQKGYTSCWTYSSSAPTRRPPKPVDRPKSVSQAAQSAVTRAAAPPLSDGGAPHTISQPVLNENRPAHRVPPGAQPVRRAARRASGTPACAAGARPGHAPWHEPRRPVAESGHPRPRPPRTLGRSSDTPLRAQRSAFAPPLGSACVQPFWVGCTVRAYVPEVCRRFAGHPDPVIHDPTAKERTAPGSWRRRCCGAAAWRVQRADVPVSTSQPLLSPACPPTRGRAPHLPLFV